MPLVPLPEAVLARMVYAVADSARRHSTAVRSPLSTVPALMRTLIRLISRLRIQPSSVAVVMYFPGSGVSLWQTGPDLIF